MLMEQRKNELDILAQQANCAGDKLYFNMKQEVFNDSMSGHEDAENYKAYCHQREIGFEEYQAHIAQKISAITTAEELHYLAVDHNFDSGTWLLQNIVLNPACDIITAKMLYWLSQPYWYYDNYGSPSKYPEDEFSFATANFLTKMEERANNEGFQTGLKLDKEIIYEQPLDFDFTIYPYCNMPLAFR